MLYSLLLYAAGVVCSAASGGLLEDFEFALGKQLSKVVSPETLLHSLSDVTAKLSDFDVGTQAWNDWKIDAEEVSLFLANTKKNSGRSFGCLEKDDGLALARTIRTRNIQNIQPYLVDNVKDKICFLFSRTDSSTLSTYASKTLDSYCIQY